MKNFNNRYLCKNIHRYFTDISDISDISVKSNYRYIRVYRYFDPCLYVVVSWVGSLCMCAMLRVEDHFWIKFTIDMKERMHKMLDAR